MAGSTNGMSFAPDGTLWVANVLGSTITQIDPDSGEILSRLTAADSVFFPDDVVVAPDGAMYWTDIGLGTVFKRFPGGPSFPLLAIPSGLNSANPLVLTDDGRLFAAGCYGGDPLGNSMVEIDPVNGGIINTLFGPVPGCASNGMSSSNGSLYAPQPFSDQVLRVDPDTGATEPVTTGWPIPIGTAVDSSGSLYALAQGVGEVVRIDLSNPDTANNRTVIAEIPVGWADNIAISGDDRIFISSASDSTVAEVLASGELRTVVPGQFELTNGVAVIDDTLYTGNLGGLWGWDLESRQQTSIWRAAFGLTPFPPTTSLVSWDEQLVLMSIISGQIVLWDPIANTATAGALLSGPIDALPFDDGLLVTLATGEVLRLSRSLEVIEVVTTVPGAVGLAADDDDVYVTDHDDGTVVRIIEDGVVLDVQATLASGLAGPEGLDVDDDIMYVVEAGAQSLTAIELKTGTRTTIASSLGFQFPSPLSSFGWLNDVTVAEDHVYVNADRSNVIYEFDTIDDDDHHDDDHHDD